MFDRHYLEWSQKRAKTIIDFFGASYFQGKTVLDLGAGHGDLGGALYRLGGKVTCVDVRQEHTKICRQKYPGIVVQQVNLDTEWPFTKFDLILDLGLICHLKNWENHLKNACNSTNNICIETAVCDSNDPNFIVSIAENKNVYDLSYHGVGSYPSAAYIEKILTESGFEFSRFDYSKLGVNVGTSQISYDWPVNETNNADINRRRFWIATRTNASVEPQPKLQMVGNTPISATQIVSAPPEVIKPTTKSILQPLMIPPAMHYRHHKEHLKSVSNSTVSGPPRSRASFVHTARKSMSSNSDTSSIRLFFNYYEDSRSERKKEIDLCLQKNLDNPLIDVIVIESATNPNYNDLFDKINSISGPNDINIICNSDIFLDETIALANNIQPKQLYALTCWDHHHPNNIAFRNDSHSQDTWIVRGPVEDVQADFQLGKYYSDNRLVYEFAKAGYKVFNPSKSIKTYHVHSSGIGRHTFIVPPDAIPGPHVFVTPTELQNA